MTWYWIVALIVAALAVIAAELYHVLVDDSGEATMFGALGVMGAVIWPVPLAIMAVATPFVGLFYLVRFIAERCIGWRY